MGKYERREGGFKILKIRNKTTKNCQRSKKNSPKCNDFDKPGHAAFMIPLSLLLWLIVQTARSFILQFRAYDYDTLSITINNNNNNSSLKHKSCDVNVNYIFEQPI